ncbi:hypothetical protein MAGR_13630 [Mycolicibacterium agri]|uniref:Uncharacterized protein n=1 Tax=Mycolicibacterium agri TaxID=36811 RepID=A0A7I9VWT9_MYCAG|nr:hypothetical protein MAGR_13630 [Mycolicibacterium agri]
MPRLTPHITANPRIAPNVGSKPKALERIVSITAGTRSAFTTTMISDSTMYTTAMNGTTIDANAAIRLTPPMMTNASTMTVPTATHHLLKPHAEFIAEAIEFDCTLGSRSPHASTVTAAKTKPYALKKGRAEVCASALLR